MTKVIIDRKRWYRGKGNTGSFLQDEEGLRCCLGFAALALGYTEREIINRRTPASVANKDRFEPLLKQFISGIPVDNETCRAMMGINDSLGHTDDEREEKLANLAPKVGLEFTFV